MEEACCGGRSLAWKAPSSCDSEQDPVTVNLFLVKQGALFIYLFFNTRSVFLKLGLSLAHPDFCHICGPLCYYFYIIFLKSSLFFT